MNLDLAELRRVRIETLSLVSALTQVDSEYSASEEKWSAGEILDHLLIADGLYTGIIRDLIDLAKAGKRPVIFKGFSEVDTTFSFLPREMLPMLTIPMTMFNLFVPTAMREAFLRNRFVAAKSPKIAVPRKGQPIETLRGGLKQSLESLEQVFLSNARLDFRSMCLIHPMLGNNSALDLIRIVYNHEKRHQSQLREALAAIPVKSAAAA
ncbi:MAG: hypothetical protein FJW39_02675 [Acidobacteria bacterium]|nr:hypothetical protein [Acidobacteriota bacterium]